MKTNVRIVSATNKNLERMVEDGEFREDLYFRLNVIPIWIPPLRERKEDIVPLFSYFLHKYSAAMDCVAPNLSQEATTILLHYQWPGNVRELQNTAQYVLHTCVDEVIRPPIISLPGSNKPLTLETDNNARCRVRAGFS